MRMTPRIWINGKFYDKADAKVSVYDHGLLYGDGVFEGIRIYHGKVFKLREHLERLYESARHITLEIPYGREQLTEHVLAAVQTNQKDGYIRLVVTRGAGTLGIDPRKTTDPQVIIIVDDIALYPPELYANGMEVVTAPTVRTAANALNPRVKSLNYLNNIMAKIEAIQAGCQEAIMLNHKGEVAECTADNLFLVKRGVLKTPPPDAGILEGITRGIVLELARAAGIPRPGSRAHPARRLHRRRAVPDRHGRRNHRRHESGQPTDRQRQAGPDHPAVARAVSGTGERMTKPLAA
jgi:branched-chain amino acid aminotransferase